MSSNTSYFNHGDRRPKHWTTRHVDWCIQVPTDHGPTSRPVTVLEDTRHPIHFHLLKQILVQSSLEGSQHVVGTSVGTNRSSKRTHTKLFWLLCICDLYYIYIHCTFINCKIFILHIYIIIYIIIMMVMMIIIPIIITIIILMIIYFYYYSSSYYFLIIVIIYI